MANENEFNFAMPGYQAPQGVAQGENGLPDFSKMTKAQIKAFDAAEGSYKRLLGGKPITMMWLMNHYSAANAAAYKAQKAQKKMGNATPSSTPQTQPQQFPVQQNQQIPIQQVPPQQSSAQFGQAPQGPYTPHSVQQGVPYVPSATPVEESNHFGNTVFIDRNRSAREPSRRATLMCVGFHRRVEISKVPFRIGRNPNQVDLCISDNETLSGCHAEITYQNGSYYITDLNSLNYTFLDGEEIPRQTPTMLHTGASIVLGNEKFIFEVGD